jgi:hypothetical protein
MMKKLVGWNIFLEYEDEEGNFSLEVWHIRSGVSNRIDEEFSYLLRELEDEEE